MYACLPCGMPAQLNLHLIFNRGEAYSSGVVKIFVFLGIEQK